ncbi:hypothetical protein [Parasphingorhabdus flavimaris]|uniref:hypothetical protein n=1 Tax=Parasphingorhabdus flavimaris TaxID=266812 RepID=UPI0030030DCC
MIQGLITWAQRQEQAVLQTYASSSEDGQLDDLVRHLTGLCAVLLSDDVVTNSGVSIWPETFDKAVMRYGSLANDPKASRGLQFEILCADHLSLPLTPLLYGGSEQEPVLRSEVAFKELAQIIIASGVIKSKNHPTGLVSAIGSTLFELFKNTEDHAKRDSAENIPSRGLRGIHARRHERTSSELEAISQAALPLAPFFSRLRPPKGRKKVRFAEFSVFDSGPGLASRWLRSPAQGIRQDEELKAIEACFEHRKTTKDSAGRGVGLPTVIAALQKRGGILRLRTGRQSLYADLAAQPDLPFGCAPAFTNFSARPNLALAAGTLITFILPLDTSE